MFYGLGRFGVGTFCSWDVLELGPFVLGRFVLGRFVLGRFVGAPLNCLQSTLMIEAANLNGFSIRRSRTFKNL
jgi:hypothetical protein